MELYSEEKLQKIFNSIQYSEPEIYCGSKNRITFLCVNKKCSAPALHCLRQTCTFCQPHKQNKCICYQLSALTSLVKKKSQNMKYLMEQLTKIETTALKKIQSKRAQLYQKAKYGDLTKQEVHIIEEIFVNKDASNEFKGSQIGDLFQKLKQKNEIQIIQEQLKKYKKQRDSITQKIIDLQQKLINEVTDPNNLYSTVISQIMYQDPVGLRFILKELNYPSQLKLLYRASEHGFSAKEFHKLCDNKPNTLTIIRTVHNKVIAGYTPLTWVSQGDTFKTDPKLETFVMSVTLRQKYFLKKDSKEAIHCTPKFGPVFGKDDFGLYNGNPTNGTVIHVDFPQSFNLNKPYEKGPQTLQKILGQQSQEKRVKVNEYEVFQILKTQQKQKKEQQQRQQKDEEKQKEQEQQKEQEKQKEEEEQEQEQEQLDQDQLNQQQQQQEKA